MPSLNPYLNFPGNAGEAFNFYKSVFGGEFAFIQRFRDTPEAPDLPEVDRDRIMHIALPISKDCILMATDALESAGHKLTAGNNFYISYSADSKQDADLVYTRLSAGGTIEMAIQNTFWNSYFGMFKDKFGIQWMVSYSENLPQ